jgi:hypothetical protein
MAKQPNPPTTKIEHADPFADLGQFRLSQDHAAELGVEKMLLKVPWCSRRTSASPRPPSSRAPTGNGSRTCRAFHFLILPSGSRRAGSQL